MTDKYQTSFNDLPWNIVQELAVSSGSIALLYVNGSLEYPLTKSDIDAMTLNDPVNALIVASRCLESCDCTAMQHWTNVFDSCSPFFQKKRFYEKRRDMYETLVKYGCLTALRSSQLRLLHLVHNVHGDAQEVGFRGPVG